MKTLIFAAGLGTRLKPFTDSVPKALFPVSGTPLLGHLLRKLAGSGVCDEVVVNVHHFADQIEEYLRENDFGLRVEISDERNLLLETGGGVLHARKLLESPFSEGRGDENRRFLVHNVDILTNLDFREFILEAPSDALATLVVSERKSSRYLLFDDQMNLCGRENVKTGIVEKVRPDVDPSKCRRLAFAGIHLMSERIFDVIDNWHSQPKFSIIDFYLAAAATNKIVGAFCPDLKVLDVGKPEAIPAAEEFVRGK